jgi:hypothetical protein
MDMYLICHEEYEYHWYSSSVSVFDDLFHLVYVIRILSINVQKIG